ncbi:SDR family NAD(P)-dependent oxidoreductase [Streptomyces tendae]|uniref:SDR family NAD(P)-dependent oxidoreductase n=1 Tax=Streptomyces tendae TaxID=1932 RepID=UPI0036B45089
MHTPDRARTALRDHERILVAPLDVTDPASIAEAVAVAEQRFGSVDVLVNAAGFVVQGTVEEITLDALRDQLENNVVGTAAVIQAILPGMRARGNGHIITFSSGAGLVGIPRMDAYAASKFAVEGLSESPARSVAHLGIEVTIIEPGVFETELGSSVVTPASPIEAYDPAAAQLPDPYDWAPGDLGAAARAVESIAGRPDAPLRLYVGHGLDEVRRHYGDRLKSWERTAQIQATTTSAPCVNPRKADEMSTWTQDELDRINAEPYFTVGATLPDGTTPKTVDIWSVPVGDRIFIRSYNGTQGKWYGPALKTGRGRISAGGVEKSVRFVPVDPDDEETNQAVDASYLEKYADSEYSVTMSTEPVRRNTLEVVPQG